MTAKDTYHPFARTIVSPEVVVLTTHQPQAVEETFVFVTRVFGGVLDGEEHIEDTAGDALAMHTAMARWCRAGLALAEAS